MPHWGEIDYTTILFIKIDFTPAGHHQLDLIQIEIDSI